MPPDSTPHSIFLLSGNTSINANDLTRLRSTIADLLGKIGSVSQAFVSDPNGNAFLPAGTRWLNEADYTELDFYFQDNWRLRSNLVLDLGVRWEPKFTPSIANGRPILVPNQPIKLGAQPSNTVRWVEGELVRKRLQQDSAFSRFCVGSIQDRQDVCSR